MKKRCKVFLAIFLVATVLLCTARWAVGGIQRIKGQELLQTFVSPDGKYTVSAYLNDGGATTDYAVLCTVLNHETGKERNIYWQYHCQKAVVQWLDEDVVKINGITLNVTKDTYDYRNAP